MPMRWSFVLACAGALALGCGKPRKVIGTPDGGGDVTQRDGGRDVGTDAVPDWKRSSRSAAYAELGITRVRAIVSDERAAQDEVRRTFGRNRGALEELFNGSRVLAARYFRPARRSRDGSDEGGGTSGRTPPAAK